jgi:hypothetical protein
MNFINRTLDDSLQGLDHLRDHLKLLKIALEALSRVGDIATIDLSANNDLITSVCVGPNPDGCYKPPGGPVADRCDGELSFESLDRFNINDLVSLADFAGLWCDAIREALGDPVRPPGGPGP